MSPSLEAGKNNSIHAGHLKGRTLFRCGRRANGDDAFRPALLQDFSWGNSKDEAECWYVRVQQHPSLIFKSLRRIWLVGWTRRPQGSKISDQRCEAPVERVFICGSGTDILH